MIITFLTTYEIEKSSHIVPRTLKETLDGFILFERNTWDEKNSIDVHHRMSKTHNCKNSPKRKLWLYSL